MRLPSIMILILLGLLFGSCAKVAKLAKQGSVNKTSYITEITFNYYNNLIFIEVSINGKTFHFFLDTGAELNVIDQSIANELEYTIITKSKVSGTSKSRQTLQLVEIPNIMIADVSFRNTGAILADLTSIKKFFGCPHIDGVIGNNLLRKAIWQIDYQNEHILITDELSKVKISGQAHVIDMEPKEWGNVHLDVSLNGIKSKYIFDTGFTGKFETNKRLFNTLATQDKDLEYITKTGELSADFINSSTGTFPSARIKAVEIDDIKLADQIVSFRQNASSLVGNGFYENYTLTMDWGNNKIFLDPEKEIQGDTLTAYELIISPNYMSNEIEISGYWDHHPFARDVSLEAKLLAINGNDVSNLSTEALCEFWEIKWKEIKKEKTIDIVVSDNGEKRNITLTKKQLLPK
ncbi:MAG: retroviral-like aspartic protease family protein [Bacteroidales bacterium]|nr:retroviral-like aspartic protease family protein [Bacteroidales bacterium]